MRAIIINEYAHPSKLKVTEDAPEPALGKDDVLVDVHSAALNFFEILQCQGKYQNQPPFPFTLGVEFSGVISSKSPIPSGCPYRAGDKVFGAGQGAYAERIPVDHRNLLPVPKGMSFDQAAGLSVTYPTSYEGLVGRAELKAGEWVLVHAGAGGVGLAAVQIAKALGAKVIATAGSQSKRDICQRVGGADAVLDYGKPGWQQEVLKLTGGKGVDVIYDPVGIIKDSLKCIAWKGRAIVVGFAGGTIEKLPTNLVLLKNISILGVHWGAYSKHEISRRDQVWKDLFRLFESGRLKAVAYDPPYRGLESLAGAMQDLEDRKTWGKAVVQIKAPAELAKL